MKNAKALVLLIALVLTVAACGGQSAEEELLEQLLESGDSGISDIDIDSDTGEINISVEGEDGGDVSISGSGDDDDFSMVIEGEDGEVMTFGTGDLPEGLVVPVQDGGKIIHTLTSGEDISAMLEYPGSEFDQLVSLYDGAISGEDVQRSESTFSSDDGINRTVNWYTGDLSVWVSVADCYSTSTGDLESVCVTINQSGS